MGGTARRKGAGQRGTQGDNRVTFLAGRRGAVIAAHTHSLSCVLQSSAAAPTFLAGKWCRISAATSAPTGPPPTITTDDALSICATRGMQGAAAAARSEGHCCTDQ